ncbi:MAG: M20/M25/M40 family metallo-hydrolase [Candidatus Ranarchaeia archaeon]|jgi:LysW-gamma-L-lysine carboxypeptidase
MNPDDLLYRMVEIYSPSGEEQEIATYLQQALTSLKIETSIDEIGNVIGKIKKGKSGPKILLCGHIDVVPPSLEVKRDTHKIYGRGAVDAKGPFATMICAALNWAKHDFDGEIILAGVVGEETNSRGIKHLIKKGIQFDFGIIGEPSNTRNLTIGYRGRIGFELTIETIPGHFGSPRSVNAITTYHKVLDEMNKVVKKEERKSLKQSITFNPSSIHSDKSNLCRGTLDVRIPFRSNSSDVIKLFKESLREATKELDNVKTELKVMDVAEPYQSDKRSDLLKGFQQAVMQETGELPRIILKTGTADINYLGSYTNAPMVVYGPGDSRMDHGPIEFVTLEDYHTAIKILTQTIIFLTNSQKSP